MPIAPPVTTNYPSPLAAIPATNQDMPPEGLQQIPVEILWTSMGGTSKTVVFNTQMLQALNFSQIATLKIDNSLCTVPVSFVFPDTMELITVAGGTKLAIIPVLSNQLTFTASSPTAIATDITRFKILNFGVPPLYMP